MTDNRNTILAVVLSGIVLLAWQFFYNVPQMEKQRAQSQIQAELAKQQPSTNTTTPATAPQTNAPPAPVFDPPNRSADGFALIVVAGPAAGESPRTCTRLGGAGSGPTRVGKARAACAQRTPLVKA